LDFSLGKNLMKNILMIAYHFPPIRVSSGIQRTLKFATYLRDHQWKPLVLTVSRNAYDPVSDDQMHEIPADVLVRRVFALDTSRHLAIKGRYLSWMALPDRWVSWCVAGVWAGLTWIVRYRPKVIWSTYPIASAHLLALLLHRITGIAWVADFRDSMTEDNYPPDPAQWRVYRWLERQVIRHCSCAVFTTPGAIGMYAGRYPEIPSSRWVLIPNGYDEENFARAEASSAYQQALAHKTNEIVLLHSGVLYPSERDPTHFFKAVSELKRDGQIQAGQLKIILRATGHDGLHGKLIAENDLQDIVFLEPNIAYEPALAEMMTVDGLLIFQAANCNHQIPAKLYEYLRARRPILALTDPEGDTARALFDAGLTDIARLDNKDDIVKQLSIFIDKIKNKQSVVADEEKVTRHSRQSRTQLLADVLAACLAGQQAKS